MKKMRFIGRKHTYTDDDGVKVILRHGESMMVSDRLLMEQPDMFEPLATQDDKVRTAKKKSKKQQRERKARRAKKRGKAVEEEPNDNDQDEDEESQQGESTSDDSGEDEEEE